MNHLKSVISSKSFSYRVTFLVRAFFVAAASICTTACSKPAPPPPAIIPTVTVAMPVQREVIEWDEFAGYLEAVDFVEVRARVSGLIDSAPFQAGAIVKKGDLLVEIDVRPFQADLDSKLAEEARAAAQVQLSEIELMRIKEMPPQASVPIERQRAEAALSEAKAVLAGAKAAGEAARLLVEWCRVTAPISGRISSRYVDPGNLITGSTGTGTLLTTIASIDPIYCIIEADERAVLKYQRLSRENKRVSARDAQIQFRMQLADEEGFRHEGVIDFVDNRIDPKTGTIKGRGILANQQGFFVPGFFARVIIPGSGLYVATLVPDEAIVTDQNQKVVYVVGAENTVEVRAVQLGTVFGDLRSIESGIATNDRVIFKGLLQVRPGTKVNPEEASFSLESLPAPPREPTPSDSDQTSAKQREGNGNGQP